MKIAIELRGKVRCLELNWISGVMADDDEQQAVSCTTTDAPAVAEPEFTVGFSRTVQG